MATRREFLVGTTALFFLPKGDGSGGGNTGQNLLSPDAQPRWTYTAGHWQVVEGELRQDAEDFKGMLADSGSAFYNEAFSNFELKCKIKIVSWARGRIIFRSPDSHSGYVAEFFTMGVADRPEWNRVTLFRRAQGRFPVELAQKTAVAFRPGQWQDVKVICRGPRVEVYLDGALVISAVDDTHRAGRIGFESVEQSTYIKDVVVEGQGVEMAWRRFSALMTYQEHLISATLEGGGDNSFSSQVQLPNGEIVLAHRVAPSHVGMPTKEYPRGGYSVIQRSTDKGLTWTNPVSAVNMRWPMAELNMHLKKDGAIHGYFITYHNWPPDKYFRPIPGYPDLVVGFWRTISKDGGRTWSEPEFLPVDYSMVCKYGGWFPFSQVVEMPNGKLVYPAHLWTQQSPDKLDQHRERTMWLGFLISSDDGRTWTPRLVPQDPALSANESSACLLPDGSIFCVARSDIQGSMWQTWSRDAGETWSRPGPIGFGGNSPFALLTSKGVLLVAHRFPGTSIHYSLDYGKTWSRSVQITSATGAYPWMTELQDGRIFVSYSHFREVTPKPLYGQLLVVDRDGVRPADPVSSG